MLRYLLHFDEELEPIRKNKSGVKVFMKLFTIGFGLLQKTQQQVKEIQDELVQFHKSETDAIFVFFIGALNHWVTFIAHKSVAKKAQAAPVVSFDDKLSKDMPDDEPKKTAPSPQRKTDSGGTALSNLSQKTMMDKLKRGLGNKFPALDDVDEVDEHEKEEPRNQDTIEFYYLDSSNLEHLNRPDADLPELFNQRVRERVLAGLKPTDHFGIKMSIQSMFDVRRSLTIL